MTKDEFTARMLATLSGPQYTSLAAACERGAVTLTPQATPEGWKVNLDIAFDAFLTLRKSVAIQAGAFIKEMGN